MINTFQSTIHADNFDAIAMMAEYWPCLSREELEVIDGRVDRLYRALVKRGATRGDAAKEIHAFVTGRRALEHAPN